MYPLGNSPQDNNNITINITKKDWSFIKAPNINHAFTDTQTDAQMHNNIYSVTPTSLYNCMKLELCTTSYSEQGLDR